MNTRLATRTSLVPIVRTVALAAGLLGAAELAVYRVIAPVLAHIPGSAAHAPFVDAVGRVGERAFAATAVLVVCGMVAAGAGALRTRRPLAVVILASVVFTLAAATTGSATIAFTGHALTIGALLGILAAAITRAGRETRPLLAGLAFAAFGLAAAQWPLLVDSWSALLGQPSQAATQLAAWTAAEVALVAAPVAFAGAFLLSATPSRAMWGAATTGALLSGAFLGAMPGYAGLISIWATGSTLSLPAFVYVLSAASAALVLAAWLSRPATRHLAAGLVLLAVAGVQPAVVHHNLTAVFALLLLASPALVAAIPAVRPAATRARETSAALAG